LSIVALRENFFVLNKIVSESLFTSVIEQVFNFFFGFICEVNSIENVVFDAV
jgi:hypothetical protein